MLPARIKQPIANSWLPIYEKIGNNIRTLRTYFKYTQEYMARELDMSCSGYAKIERNEIEISVKRLFQIAAIFDVPLEMLIYLNPDWKNNPNSENIAFIEDRK